MPTWPATPASDCDNRPLPDLRPADRRSCGVLPVFGQLLDVDAIVQKPVGNLAVGFDQSARTADARGSAPLCRRREDRPAPLPRAPRDPVRPAWPLRSSGRPRPGTAAVSLACSSSGSFKIGVEIATHQRLSTGLRKTLDRCVLVMWSSGPGRQPGAWSSASPLNQLRQAQSSPIVASAGAAASSMPLQSVTNQLGHDRFGFVAAANLPAVAATPAGPD